MMGLSFVLEGVYFNCFRKHTTTSVILTYPIPPFTTIRGLIANVLGIPQFPDSKKQYLFIQQAIKIGILPIKMWNKSTELTKLLKLKGDGKKFERVFPSSPMFKEFLINPEYKIFIISNNDALTKNIYKKLQNPERPLYLGQSDDMVDTQNIKLVKNIETKKIKSKEIWSVIEGIHNACEIIKLPYKFSEDGKNLQQLLVSVPPNYPFISEQPIECYKFNGQTVCVF